MQKSSGDEAQQIKAFSQADIQEVYQQLGTSAQGLTSAEAKKREEKYGENVIQKKKQEPLILRFLKNFTSLMAILLWVGGAVAMFAGMMTMGIAIWLVNIINGIFSFWQEFQATKATDALSKMLPSYVRAMRDGKQQQILAQDVVPGDVIAFEEGDNVAADMRLISSTDLKADQAALTGESNPIAKSLKVDANTKGRYDENNILYAGTSISTGSGTGVVLSTGMNTEFGHIAQLTQSVKPKPSPLEKELDVLTRQISLLAITMGVLFFVAAIFIVHYPWAQAFIFALGMVVAFIPEGLLPTVTLSLAAATNRMAKKHALVKQLSSVETLGSTNVICSDKTGTLTQNQMTVQQLWLPKESLTVTGLGYSPDGQVQADGKQVEAKNDSDLNTLLTGAALDSNARVVAPTEKNPKYTVLGDPTEACLGVAAQKSGINLDDLHKQLPRVKEIPFDSDRKRMTTIQKVSDTERVAYIKGAPSEVLAVSTAYLKDGQVQPLSDELKNKIMAQNDSFAKEGLRVLGVGYRDIVKGKTDLPDSLDDYSIDNVEQQMVFVGLIAMSDPPRPEVAQAIKECHEASIKVIMVTGDYGLTAESISRKIGIIGPDEDCEVVTGPQLAKMNDKELKDALRGPIIFARMAPEQKYRIVNALQEMGNIVAVTGDGVNDAPALKKADIGIAMGKNGTDVAKEAANMILTDDNFASIVSAIEEGRTVYSNIQKFLLYILNSNAPEAAPSIAFLFSNGLIPLPLTVMQILSVDLGTDMLPALGLGTEQTEPGTMQKPPRSQKDHLISKGLVAKAFGWYGLVASLISLGAYFFVNHVRGGWPNVALAASGTPIYREATTMTLAAIVFCQIAAAINCRTKKISVFKIGLFSNKRVWEGIIFEICLIIALIYIPFLQGIFNTAPLQWNEWLFLICIPIPLVLIEELRKYFVRRHDARKKAEAIANKAA
ncbi:hypothetical protein IV38_GL001247 [Lactobacillus selangorensis]|uniref:Cation-transporting P-type ATPase N-terminal domain-containing protein n=1 Tax=Lactobacillus selangorensis TaxID=81857 RepID=A0A0R2FKC2_9LACO|nr:cation-transporting P-type ATPase [Lactobacillus selangorensis]KRN29032.1 hypothetical protein IV38_GL001247 [Lactobacillus selangorensis]KRN32558.1 hypothetical protein IV40_GL000606 [Lactobacillus selangorensis]